MWSYFKITLWAIIWLFVWLVVFPFRKNRDNCLTWAMKKFDEEEGYLVIRWCRSSKYKWLRWPHFLWLSKEHHEILQHCIPKEETTNKKIFPQPWFNGYVKQGDEDESKEN